MAHVEETLSCSIEALAKNRLMSEWRTGFSHGSAHQYDAKRMFVRLRLMVSQWLNFEGWISQCALSLGGFKLKTNFKCSFCLVKSIRFFLAGEKKRTKWVPAGVKNGIMNNIFLPFYNSNFPFSSIFVCKQNFVVSPSDRAFLPSFRNQVQQEF